MCSANIGQCHPFGFVANKESDGRDAGWNNAAGPDRRIIQHRRMWRQSSPTHGPGQAELIEEFWIVVADAARPNLPFPGAGWNFKPLQLAKHFQRTMFIANLRSRSNMLPAQ